MTDGSKKALVKQGQVPATTVFLTTAKNFPAAVQFVFWELKQTDAAAERRRSRSRFLFRRTQGQVNSSD